MRERNKEFNMSIGELTEEIRKQDLETVNGGNENNNRSTIACATVAATSAVVTKTIPANVIAGGNPCKVLKTIE